MFNKIEFNSAKNLIVKNYKIIVKNVKRGIFVKKNGIFM